MSTADEALALAKQIAPLLAGKGSDVQSAALADLVATWLVGLHPAIRAAAVQEFSRLISRLIVVNEKIAFGDEGHPGWKDADDETPPPPAAS